MVDSLAMEQSNTYSSVSKVILKDMGKSTHI